MASIDTDKEVLHSSSSDALDAVNDINTNQPIYVYSKARLRELSHSRAANIKPLDLLSCVDRSGPKHRKQSDCVAAIRLGSEPDIALAPQRRSFQSAQTHRLRDAEAGSYDVTSKAASVAVDTTEDVTQWHRVERHPWRHRSADWRKADALHSNARVSVNGSQDTPTSRRPRSDTSRFARPWNAASPNSGTKASSSSTAAAASRHASRVYRSSRSGNGRHDSTPRNVNGGNGFDDTTDEPEWAINGVEFEKNFDFSAATLDRDRCPSRPLVEPVCESVTTSCDITSVNDDASSVNATTSVDGVAGAPDTPTPRTRSRFNFASEIQQIPSSSSSSSSAAAAALTSTTANGASSRFSFAQNAAVSEVQADSGPPQSRFSFASTESSSLTHTQSRFEFSSGHNTPSASSIPLTEMNQITLNDTSSSTRASTHLPPSLPVAANANANAAAVPLGQPIGVSQLFEAFSSAQKAGCQPSSQLPHSASALYYQTEQQTQHAPMLSSSSSSAATPIATVTSDAFTSHPHTQHHHHSAHHHNGPAPLYAPPPPPQQQQQQPPQQSSSSQHHSQPPLSLTMPLPPPPPPQQQQQHYATAHHHHHHQQPMSTAHHVSASTATHLPYKPPTQSHVPAYVRSYMNLAAHQQSNATQSPAGAYAPPGLVQMLPPPNCFVPQQQQQQPQQFYGTPTPPSTGLSGAPTSLNPFFPNTNGQSAAPAYAGLPPMSAAAPVTSLDDVEHKQFRA